MAHQNHYQEPSHRKDKTSILRNTQRNLHFNCDFFFYRFFFQSCYSLANTGHNSSNRICFPERTLEQLPCLLCPSWVFVRSPRLTCHRCPLSAWLRTTLHQCGAAPDPGGSSWPARDVYLTCLKTHTSYFVSPDQPTCYQAPFVPFLDHFLAIIPLPSHVIMARLAGCNLRR